MAGLALAISALFSLLTAAPAAAARTNAVAGNPAAVRAYAGVLRKINPQMPSWQSRALAKHMLINANRWKIDANMLVALVSVESAWHTHARSWAGALGLGQLMPGTAANLHVNPHDPYQNLQGAARYLYGLLAKYRHKANRYALAFAAYNAGPKAVAEYGGIPPYSETQRYVVKVLAAWKRIRGVVHIPKAVIRRKPVLIGSSDSHDLAYWTNAKR